MEYFHDFNGFMALCAESKIVVVMLMILVATAVWIGLFVT